jgi:hypothetical protein
MPSGWSVAVISVFYAAGFAVLGFGLWGVRRSSQAAGWPTAPAMVTHLEMKESSGREGATYQVIVRYTYTVDGVTYTGDRLAFGYVDSDGREAHEQIYRKLKGATVVAARYDPAHPAEACLSYGIHRSIWYVLAFAATWLAFMFGITFLWWLSTRPDPVMLDNLSVQ